MKRRYYQNKTKYVYPRKRWASNIVSQNALVTLTGGETVGQANATICANAVQTSTPTPVIVKFGRCRVKGDIRTDLNNANNFVSGTMYVLFCPQGTNANINLVNQHPEYVVGWTQISLDSGNSFSFTSNLKRNLQSGDQINLLFYVNSLNSTQTARNFNFYYTVQYWTTSA